MPASLDTRHASIPASAVRHPTPPVSFSQVSRGAEGNRAGGARVPRTALRPGTRHRRGAVGRLRTLALLDPRFHPEGLRVAALDGRIVGAAYAVPAYAVRLQGRAPPTRCAAAPR